MLPSNISPSLPSRLRARNSGAMPTSLPASSRPTPSHSSPLSHSPPPSVDHHARWYSCRKKGTSLTERLSRSFHSPARPSNSGLSWMKVRFMVSPGDRSNGIVAPAARSLQQRLHAGDPFCTIAAMASTLDADVALIHIARSESRLAAPPGTLAQSPPRRAARGRSEDLLFLSVSAHAVRPLPTGLLDQLAHLATEAYYGTPGSVTAALRQAASEINDHLLDLNQQEQPPLHAQGRVIAGVLRGADLYLCQCGVGQTIVVRPGQLTRLASEEAASRPLGLSPTPFVRYHHFELRPGDLLILTTAPPPGWSEATLSGLSGLDPQQALDRLVAASANDLTGILVRLTQPGATTVKARTAAAVRPTPAAAPAPTVSPVAPPSRAPARPAPPLGASAAPRPAPTQPSPSQAPPPLAAPAAAPSRPRLRARPGSTAPMRRAQATPRFVPREPPAWRLALGGLGGRVAEGLRAAGARVSEFVLRLAPGLAEPSRPGELSPRILAITAVAVPLVIVTIASVVYFRSGRNELFDEYLGLARAAAVSAQTKPTAQEAWPDWNSALSWLDLAESYGQTEESQTLRA